MKHSILKGFVAALISITTITSCQVGRKPVIKNVSIDKDTIRQRYGINTVDTATPAAGNDETVANSAEKTALIQTLLPLLQNEINFSTFSGKAKMHYASNDQKQEFVANIRISKDKIIWVNITALGGMVNAARAYITPDSIYFVNYLQKEAYRVPISEGQKLLPMPVDFTLLQNMIVGNVLSKNGTPLNATAFGGTWTLELKDDSIAQQLGFNKADSSLRSQQVRTQDDAMQAMIQYGNYQQVDNRKFSTGRVITISNAGQPHYMDMDFNKAEFDTPLEFPFQIPKNYTIK
ncbi:MAG TPA: DUF4292 domain-containing protein [Flavipsychrobacter sp.]